MRAGGRNADVMFSGKADKITGLRNSGKLFAIRFLSTFPAAFLPKAFVAEGSSMVISISKKHCLLQAEAWRILSSSAAFPGRHQLALGGRGDNHQVPHPHPVVRGLCVLGRVEDVGHNPQRNSKSTELCPQPAEAVQSSPLSAAHPPTSSRRGPGGSQLWGC